MKISTKGRYALRMLLDLAMHQNNEYVALKDIAERQNISKKYLEQIVPLLNKSGLLKTNRGYQGGYMLAKSPDQYTVGEILRITEGSLAPIPCLEFEVNECPRADSCMTLDVWAGLYKAVTDYLDGVTLQDIIEKSSEKSGSDFCI
ncbi:MAG: RrF2 family transcriptional regulator [Huintestinicola sp.]